MRFSLRLAFRLQFPSQQPATHTPVARSASVGAAGRIAAAIPLGDWDVGSSCGGATAFGSWWTRVRGVAFPEGE